METGYPATHGQRRLAAEDHLRSLRSEGRALAELAADQQALRRSSVPGCPGWNAADVLRHLGSVYRRTTAWLAEGAEPARWEYAPVSGVSLGEWFATGHAALLDALTARGPDAEADSWLSRQDTVAFWYRRMALETAVHRVDVQAAVRAEGAEPLSPGVAVDAVDEVLTVWLTHFAAASRQPPPADWHYLDGHRATVTTGAHCWRVRFGPSRVTVRRQHAGDVDEPGGAASREAAVAGDASPVALYLWGRLPGSAVELTGDPGVLVAFRKRLAAVTR